MGLILELVTNENFQKRTAMFVGRRSWRDVGSWLRGVEFYQHKSFPDQSLDLDGFREWLHMRFDGPGNTDWAGVIESVFGGNEEATDKAFECLEDFFKDIHEIGLEQLIADHAEYEKRRYGFLSSSRLRDFDDEQIFFASLNEEVKSEKCKKEGCESNRIKNSVLCRNHHFEMIKKRPAPKPKQKE